MIEDHIREEVLARLAKAEQVPAIQQFIVQELERLQSIAPARVERKNVEPRLSDVFRRVLQEAWA